MTKRIVFIHGIGAKPEKRVYLQQWIEALGMPLPPVRCRMAYWADLRGDHAPGTLVKEVMTPPQRQILSRTTSPLKFSVSWWDRLQGLLWGRMLDFGEPVVRRFLERQVNDVYTYFFKPGMRPAISDRLVKELNEAEEVGEDVILISHSMGTVIAVDVLKTIKTPISLFVTLGSPLGNSWLQHKLGSPSDLSHVWRWVNIYDHSDPVAMPDRELANDWKKWNVDVEDFRCRPNRSPEGELDPHHWYGYLSCSEIKKAVDAAIMLKMPSRRAR